MNVDDSALLTVLENQTKLRKKYGADGARKLRNCILSLEAAKSLAEYLPPKSGAYRCHQLTGDRANQFAMSFTGKNRLVFEPVFDGSEDLSNGIDWHLVKNIKLIELIDYH